MIANLLIALLLLLPTATEHRVSFYWPSEDGWGTAVADQVLMRRYNGHLPQESWDWPIVAVSRDVERLYPMGTCLFIEGIGFKWVHDRTASWVTDTVDIRVSSRHMECYRARVWLIYSPVSP